jgi:hypothetical protein
MTSAVELRLESTGGAWRLNGSGVGEFGLVNDYLGYLAGRNYSPRTVRAYGFDLLAFCRWLVAEHVALQAVDTETLLGFLRACREASVPGRPGGNVVSLSGQRLDRYAATTVNHRLAAITGLFTFRAMREPDAPNPVPSGREARRAAAGERNGLLAHLVPPKRRSALRLREPKRLPRALDRTPARDHGTVGQPAHLAGPGDCRVDVVLRSACRGGSRAAGRRCRHRRPLAAGDR